MAEVTQDFKDKVLTILAEVCESDEIKKNPDLQLFDEGLLDSFATISLVVEFEQQLEISVPISDFNREEWATPNMIVNQLAERK
ncbi:D-alanine--poly(phosphoribitol) ligase subunit DltC [Sporolactobacillus laevolacticus]|uniref:D-alanyl carrier protein n=1 Tax=Sporolactobacillus laevolacticus DSM 442 TaxID=1395513 RepID=V6IWD8_9BACL|nr:D-alanine--poly(phosphoribitol) ligase subunit DltC [Sporolactobacillus laevolacticus]EST10861.1 D-alanine--poly(phosphoribitol) ligase [Sporolactobacillus laevolacticus DSM 442]